MWTETHTQRRKSWKTCKSIQTCTRKQRAYNTKIYVFLALSAPYDSSFKRCNKAWYIDKSIKPLCLDHQIFVLSSVYFHNFVCDLYSLLASPFHIGERFCLFSFLLFLFCSFWFACLIWHNKFCTFLRAFVLKSPRLIQLV